MPRTGKCPNYTRCLLAGRDEIISLPDDAPFVCPECKLPLLAARADGRRPITIPVIILGGISMLVITGAIAVYIQVRHFREAHAPGQIGTSFEQAEIAAEHGEFMPSRHMVIPVSPTPIPDTADASGAGGGNRTFVVPSPTIGGDSGVQAQVPDLNLPDAWKQRTRILGRISPVPASGDLATLSMALWKATKMGRIITIPFPAGHVALSPADVDQLRAVLASAELKPFLTNPACVLVILGFADLNGDENTSLHISAERAQSVLNTLRDRCGVTNVMYAVGMGSSTAQRNQLVEIWAVLP